MPRYGHPSVIPFPEQPKSPKSRPKSRKTRKIYAERQLAALRQRCIHVVTAFKDAQVGPRWLNRRYDHTKSCRFRDAGVCICGADRLRDAISALHASI
ncbi:MAG TPA: hypothetical protein VKB20_11920 [Steroidobacteraceae bacterium]|nr:hypothetical protein [Steroidobacteraceae bacterium]